VQQSAAGLPGGVAQRIAARGRFRCNAAPASGTEYRRQCANFRFLENANRAMTTRTTTSHTTGRVYRFRTLLAELKRRSVFKVATVYAVTAWGASMGAAQLLPAFDAPAWSVRLFVLFAILGLPIAIVLAWAFEFTPEGIVRDDAGDGDASAASLLAAVGNTTMLFGAQGTVRVTWQDGAGFHEKVFQKGFHIGRDESCELHLDDPMISRRHAEVYHSEGRWWIADLGSRNGTLLDQLHVTRSPLPTQCEVKLYEASPVLRLEVRAASTAPTVTPSQLRFPTS
jgi:hypothetical protein